MSALTITPPAAAAAVLGRAPLLGGIRLQALGLVEFWHAGVGITLDANGGVASWRGMNGSIAQQPTPAARPVLTGGAVDFAAGGNYLVTQVVPNATAGYLVSKVRRAAGGSGSQAALLAGEHATASAPFQNLSLGFASSNVATAYLGSSTPANFVGLTAVPGGSTAVVGVGWNAGAGALRLNGVQEAARTYNDQTNGTPAGVGTLPMWIGGANQVVSGLFRETADAVVSIAIFAGPLTDAQRATVDGIMAAL